MGETSFLTTGGECGRLIAQRDWSGSLGPVEAWPQSLRTTVGLVLASALPMVLLWGEEGIMLYNDGYRVICGARHPQVLGMPVREAWPEAAAFNDNVLRKGLSGEALAYRDMKFMLSRGGETPEQVCLDLNYSPAPGEDGKPAGVLAVVVETTDRVRLAGDSAAAQAALRAERDRAQDVLDNMDEALVLLDRDYRIVDLNAEAERLEPRPRSQIIGKTHSELQTLTDALPVLISYVDADYRYGFINKIYETWFPHRRDDILGKPVRDVLGEAAFARIESKMAAAMAGQRVKFEAFMPYRDGPARHVEIEYLPRIAEAGVEGFYTLVQDVTERKAAEAALRESEARLRALTDNLPSGMVFQVMVTPDGTGRRFLFVSQSQERLTGVPVADILADANAAYERIVPEDRPALVAAEARAIEARSPFDVEARFQRTDGEVRWCRIISAPREQPDGSMIWDGIQIDITEQKAAEASLRQLNATLEERVQEAVDERIRTEEALRQSRKLEAMGQLTGGVAHDFNNLLTPIIGSVDMVLRSGQLGERDQRLLDGSLQSAERAKTLVQRLLAFARRQPLQPGPVDVAQTVVNMTDLIGSTLGPRIRLDLDIAPDIPLAQADANQLEMALLNLCVNARDAMSTGGRLGVSLAQATAPGEGPATLPPGRYVRLAVADTGEGMDAATLGRAIEPFFSTKGVGRGTGLGLSMVHGLAAQLGGDLTIDSEVGVGTQVTLWLPVSKAINEPVTPATAITRQASLAFGRVLLVDDEDLVRASTAEMLEQMGYRVEQACCAEEALTVLEGQGPFDLLVTDHLMPGMTGADLARQARARRPSLQVLVISGYAEADGVAPDLPRLTKPFREAELAAMIASLTADA